MYFTVNEAAMMTGMSGGNILYHIKTSKLLKAHKKFKVGKTLIDEKQLAEFRKNMVADGSPLFVNGPLLEESGN